MISRVVFTLPCFLPIRIGGILIKRKKVFVDFHALINFTAFHPLSDAFRSLPSFSLMNLKIFTARKRKIFSLGGDYGQSGKVQ